MYKKTHALKHISTALLLLFSIAHIHAADDSKSISENGLKYFPLLNQFMEKSEITKVANTESEKIFSSKKYKACMELETFLQERNKPSKPASSFSDSSKFLGFAGSIINAAGNTAIIKKQIRIILDHKDDALKWDEMESFKIAAENVKKHADAECAQERLREQQYQEYLKENPPF